MKKFIFSLLAVSLLSIQTQAQDLPKPSPDAELEQRVGLTDIKVKYSRPGVKGRTVWGDLVPYNEVWRAGANKATMFSTSSDILINGEMLPQGEYSIFIIPMKDGEWTIIWNTETELWGAGDYKEENDQLRVNVPAESIKGVSERLEYRFIQVDMKTGVLAMDWAGKRVQVSIEADPAEQVKANIAAALEDSKEEDLWRVYRSAASYAEDAGMTKDGLEWIAKSVELKENWYSYWVYGSLLAQNKEFKRAAEMGKKAIEMLDTAKAKAK